MPSVFLTISIFLILHLASFIDHLANELNIQIILTDHHHFLPGVINRKLVLDHFNIAHIEKKYTPYPYQKNKKHNISVPEQDQVPVVEMKDVTIAYSNKTVIDKFNWTIKKGERWALTGKNGSGKTTLFSLIYADHPKAYSNEIYLFGKRRGTGESIWDIKKRISYLGPELITFLNPKNVRLSGLQYIQQLAKDTPDEKLNKLIAFFHAGNFIGKPIAYLSSGQLQLVLLIHFFLHEKELLLLDEPFQFLDSRQKELVTSYLQSHLNADTTLILITHYEEDIDLWTEQIMRLK